MAVSTIAGVLAAENRGGEDPRRRGGRLGRVFVGSGGGSLPAHPRILGAGELAFLQTQRTNNTSRWQNVKATADAQVAKGSTVVGTDVKYVTNAALLYAVTGDQSYADRVDAVLLGFCVVDPLLVVPPFLQYDRGYKYANEYWHVIRCLDWAYQGLSVTARQRAATWLMDFADYIWPDVNNASSGNLANTAYNADDAGSNYYWRYMYTGAAALAAWEDDTGTSITTPGSTSPRPAFHLNYYKSKWANEAAVYFAAAQNGTTNYNGGLGGGFAEGPGYGTHTTWEAYRGIRAVFAAGETFDTSIVDPVVWADESLLYNMSVTCPGYAYRVGYGDSGAASTTNNGSYNRSMLLNLMATSTNATRKGQALRFIDTIGNVPSNDNGLGGLLDELLYYDPAATPAADLSGLPLYHYAAGAGFWEYRNSWTDPNSTFWSFDGGASSGHSGENSSHVRIWKGGDFISCSGNRYSDSGIRKEAEYYNNLTLDGDGQNPASTVNPPLTYQTPTANLVAVRGDSTSAYNLYSTPRLSDGQRCFAYLPTKDTFIDLYDVTTVDPGVVKAIGWHMKNLPDPPGSNTFKLSNPAADFHAYGKIVATRGGTPTLAVGHVNLRRSTQPVEPDKTSISAGGSGYAVGDTGTINNIRSGTAAEYVVDSVDGSGAVTGFTVTVAGTNYGEHGIVDVGTTNAGSQPGSGTGFRLWVNTTSHRVVVTLPTGTARQIVCTTLQLSAGAAAPYAVSATDDITHFTVVVDNLTVTIPLDPSSDVTVA